jgi:hypothetical protein
VRLYIPGVEDFFRREIACFGWSMADRDPASLAREYGEARKENGDSSKSLRMNRTSPLFHPLLHL